MNQQYNFTPDQKKHIDELKRDIDNLNALMQMMQALNKDKSTIASQIDLSAKFVEHLLLKLRTNPRLTWDKASMYQFIRKQYSDFVVKAATENGK